MDNRKNTANQTSNRNLSSFSSARCAPIRLRLGAFLLNAVVCVIGYLLSALLWFMVRGWIRHSQLLACANEYHGDYDKYGDCVEGYFSSSLAAGLSEITGFFPLVYILIYLGLQRLCCGYWLRHSLGKKCLGLQIVTLDNKPIGKMRGVVRFAVVIVMGFVMINFYFYFYEFRFTDLFLLTHFSDITHGILDSASWLSSLPWSISDLQDMYEDGYLFAIFLLIAYTFDAVFLLINKRCLHDYVVGTKVVRVQ